VGEAIDSIVLLLYGTSPSSVISYLSCHECSYGGKSELRKIKDGEYLVVM
jgi:hypothetical protein